MQSLAIFCFMQNINLARNLNINQSMKKQRFKAIWGEKYETKSRNEDVKIHLSKRLTSIFLHAVTVWKLQQIIWS